MRIVILCLASALFVQGCADRYGQGPPKSSRRGEPSGNFIAPDLKIIGWLRPAASIADSTLRDECRMLRAARADSAHCWLQTIIDLDTGDCIRVEGPGALAVRLSVGGREVVHRDAGLFVPIHDDASAFLNSSSGPISIRHYHDSGFEGRGTRILLRLPLLAIDQVEILGITPVQGRWVFHH